MKYLSGDIHVVLEGSEGEPDARISFRRPKANKLRRLQAEAARLKDENTAESLNKLSELWNTTVLEQIVSIANLSDEDGPVTKERLLDFDVTWGLINKIVGGYTAATAAKKDPEAEEKNDSDSESSNGTSTSSSAQASAATSASPS